jgi:HSP20 family protein
MFDMITNNKRMRDLFESNFITGFLNPNGHFGFKLDIKEYDSNYDFIVEVPGIKKEDITIQMENNLIHITVDKLDEIEEQPFNYVRKERKCGSMTRSFQVSEVNCDDITAHCHDGILRINLPKSQTNGDQTRTIMID